MSNLLLKVVYHRFSEPETFFKVNNQRRQVRMAAAEVQTFRFTAVIV